MNSVTLTVLRTIAEELPPDGSAPTFPVEHIIAKVWDRSGKELREAGFTPDDLRAIAVGAWKYAESSGWSRLKSLLLEPVAEGNSVLELGPGFTRAGILEVLSGRWAWMAREIDRFVHVSLQMIGSPTDRMEGAVKEDEFSLSQVERIARDPSIRWWWDRTKEVTWEIRTSLRLGLPAARELTFSHPTLGSRSTPIADDVRLGELSEVALQQLLTDAEKSPSDASGDKNRLGATA